MARKASMWAKNGTRMNMKKGKSMKKKGKMTKKRLLKNNKKRQMTKKYMGGGDLTKKELEEAADAFKNAATAFRTCGEYNNDVIKNVIKDVIENVDNTQRKIVLQHHNIYDKTKTEIFIKNAYGVANLAMAAKTATQAIAIANSDKKQGACTKAMIACLAAEEAYREIIQEYFSNPK